MRIDPEDLRRYYESLSDEGFLDIDRSDLAPVAQGIYDQEIARRGLDHPPEQEILPAPLTDLQGGRRP